jgi:hypothetical protein
VVVGKGGPCTWYRPLSVIWFVVICAEVPEVPTTFALHHIRLGPVVALSDYLLVQCILNCFAVAVYGPKRWTT